jgi:hypothetical protein
MNLPSAPGPSSTQAPAAEEEVHESINSNASSSSSADTAANNGVADAVRNCEQWNRLEAKIAMGEDGAGLLTNRVTAMEDGVAAMETQLGSMQHQVHQVQQVPAVHEQRQQTEHAAVVQAQQQLQAQQLIFEQHQHAVAVAAAAAEEAAAVACTEPAAPTAPPIDSDALEERLLVRCAFFDRNLHSRMPLVPTLARLKRAGV